MKRAVPKTTRLNPTKVLALESVVASSKVIKTGEKSLSSGELNSIIGKLESRIKSAINDTEKKELEEKMKKYKKIAAYTDKLTATKDEKKKLSKKVLSTKNRLKAMKGILFF